MLLVDIKSELARLQIHPVNLHVTIQDEQLVAFGGSLLHYWTVPRTVDAECFLNMLRALPDAAGASIVMTALFALTSSQPQSAPFAELAPIAVPLDPTASG